MWSKSMEKGTDIDPGRRGLEQQLQDADRKYQLSSNGTYELPFGTGHFLLGNAPGWVQQVVNKWQLGGVFNYMTGAPISLVANGIQTISTQEAKPNVVGEIPQDMGKVTKLANAVVYFDGYTQIADPSCTPTTLQGMNTGYSNKAIVAPNGQVILVNPQPGEVATLGYSTFRGPGIIRFDANLVKRFRIAETKEFEFRLDAINVLNTPNWGDPEDSIHDTNFGRVTSATGERRFVVNARINF
jgi:hypothetical protein